MAEAEYQDFEVIDEHDLIDYLSDLIKMHPSEQNLDERHMVTSVLNYGKSLRDQGFTPVYLQCEDEEEVTILLTVEETLTFH